jgi:hypothetical protein
MFTRWKGKERRSNCSFEKCAMLSPGNGDQFTIVKLVALQTFTCIIYKNVCQEVAIPAIVYQSVFRCQRAEHYKT